jgi:hypothetical protein
MSKWLYINNSFDLSPVEILKIKQLWKFDDICIIFIFHSSQAKMAMASDLRGCVCVCEGWGVGGVDGCLSSWFLPRRIYLCFNLPLVWNPVSVVAYWTRRREKIQWSRPQVGPSLEIIELFECIYFILRLHPFLGSPSQTQELYT